mgnify:CR=1 FL=1
MLSRKQQDFVLAPFNRTLDVAEGTPRSGKTTACVLRYFLFLNISRDENHLIVGATQTQAFRLAMDSDGNGLLHLFQGAKIKHDDFGDYLDAETASGHKKIYYKGGAKADSDKSIRGLSLGSVYFCEIDILHASMVQECLRRTYAAHIRWHLADLNPPAPQHPVIRDVFDVQDTRWTHWTVDDNPVITDERKKELRQTLAKNPYLYKRDWLGERCIPQGVIYSMFDPQKHTLQSIPAGWAPIEMYFAGDGGLTDATSVGCYMVYRTPDGFVLVRLAGWYYDGGNKAMSVQARELAGTYAPWCRQRFGRRESGWYIDPACKALRKELELFGVYSSGADNNGRDAKGNRRGIEVGIEYAQSCIQEGRFFLLENEEYGHLDFIREAGMYCVDDHGHPVDAYNHAMDEFRYSVNKFVKNYVY